MASLNKVFLIGGVGKDPEVRQFNDGGKVCTFPLATSEVYTDRNGQRIENKEWHNIVLKGKLADLSQYITKGSHLYIEGKISTRDWTDQQGQKHYATEIVGINVQLLDPKPQQAPAQQPAYPPQPQTPPQAPQPQYAPPAQPTYPQGGAPVPPPPAPSAPITPSTPYPQPQPDDLPW